MLLLLLLHLGACWVHRLAAHDSSQGLGHAPAVRPLVVNFEIGRPRELVVDKHDMMMLLFVVHQSQPLASRL